MTIVDEQAWNVEPPPSSLSPQGLNGIYASRATCGDITGEQRHARQRQHQSGLAFHSLGQGNYLVVIEVQESSYQPHYLFMHYSETGRTAPRVLKLKTYEGDDDDVNKVATRMVAEVEGIPTFDDAKKQLVFHTKGRGTGDCGSLVKYNITPTRAIPVEARVHACFDDYSLGITDPQRWRRLKRL